jgi:hypothetical protein
LVGQAISSLGQRISSLGQRSRTLGRQMIGEVGHGRSLLGHRTAGMLGQRTMMLGWHRMIGLDGGNTRRSRSNAA